MSRAIPLRRALRRARGRDRRFALAAIALLAVAVPLVVRIAAGRRRALRVRAADLALAERNDRYAG